MARPARACTPFARRRRAGGWFAIALWKVIVPLAFAAASGLCVADWFANAQLQGELAGIKEAGKPTELSDLAKPRVSPAQNAAPIYIHTARVVKLVDDRALLDFISLDPERRAKVDLALVQRKLSQVEDEIARVRRASALPGCQFPVNWSAGPNATFEHYAQVRSLARVLSAHARLCALDGRRSEAMSDVAAVLGIARHIGQEPVLLASLVEYAVVGIARSALQSVLNECRPTPLQCQPVVRALDRMDLRSSLVRALEGERCFGLASLDAPAAGSISQPPGGGSGLTSRIPVVSLTWRTPNRLRLEYIRLMSEMIHAAKSEPGWSSLKWKAEAIGCRYRSVAFAVPPYSTVFRTSTRAQAEVAVMQAALAVHLYRLKTGHFPLSLGDVQKAVGRPLLNDPFTDGLLRYRLNGRGYVLYSVGPNRRDDGGQGLRRPGPPEAELAKWQDDIVLALEVPRRG
ncbi:MAG: hypothetical protein ACUVTZ_14205 [Armatimonadota bacterium]